MSAESSSREKADEDSRGERGQLLACGDYVPANRTLWEDMRELAFPSLTTASNCFTELSPAAKAFVLDRWRKWKGLP